ncbi:MAG: penicillin-binding protein 2 [Nitrospinaceae bacterium]|nr:MAG: penicillin-binding protein 2 [Nitrospinaceae bacterium]
MSVFRYSADVSETVRGKIKIFVVLVIIAFLCLWMRIWYLQILKGAYFQAKSENNRVRLTALPAYRGTIKDRNEETLVSIRPSFNLYVTPEDAQNLPETLKWLQEIIEFDKDQVFQRIKETPPFKQVLIKRDIDRKQVAIVEESKMRLPGIDIKVEPLRSYVYGDMATHVLGYLGEISKTKLESLNDPSFEQGDFIGKNGLEIIYETMLRGKKGYKEVEVDVSGRELQTLRKLPPKSGNTLVLTLDLRVQKVLEEVMTGTPEDPISGSVVAMKVHTGEIIAIASKPSFDSNLFAAGISRDNWKTLVEDELHPLQHRTISGQYPPGSTYKIVTALAGLEENIVTPETTFYCPGHFRLGRGKYRCWKRGGHGTVDLHKALVQSCDVYFYTVGNRLGIDKLHEYARMLGLGEYTGIQLMGEKRGINPSTKWKLASRNEPWLLGETISASIGQGYNLVTPLQQAKMMATVANGGVALKPYLVKKIIDPDGKTIKEFHAKVENKIKVHPEYLELVKKALLGVVNEPRGTGRRSRLKDIQVSGKTGTAQVVKLKVTEDIEDEDKIPYHFRDHAWFVAFAPYEKPEIAVAVLVEHGGHGGASAAPVAKKVMEAYFKHYPPYELLEKAESIANGVQEVEKEEKPSNP